MKCTACVLNLFIAVSSVFSYVLLHQGVELFVLVQEGLIFNNEDAG